jgi:hypothetical protein
MSLLFILPSRSHSKLLARVLTLATTFNLCLLPSVYTVSISHCSLSSLGRVLRPQSRLAISILSTKEMERDGIMKKEHVIRSKDE